jgi:hypothetical protein
MPRGAVVSPGVDGRIVEVAAIPVAAWHVVVAARRVSASGRDRQSDRRAAPIVTTASAATGVVAGPRTIAPAVMAPTATRQTLPRHQAGTGRHRRGATGPDGP